jgi:protein phosphatase
MFYEKERNGDHLLLHDIKDENILIALVADGITNRPCDWLASEMTCTEFFEYFSNNNSIPMEKRIIESIRNANNILLSVADKCHGLANTLTLVVWDYKGEEFFFANLGDSRLYQISDGKTIQLTKDDSITVEKNVRTSFGIRDIKALTNHLGRDFPDVLINKGNIKTGDLLLLASDGFYDARKSTFEKDIIELSRSVDLQTDFNKLFGKYQILPHDDMTAIIIRKTKNISDSY